MSPDGFRVKAGLFPGKELSHSPPQNQGCSPLIRGFLRANTASSRVRPIHDFSTPPPKSYKKLLEHIDSADEAQISPHFHGVISVGMPPSLPTHLYYHRRCKHPFTSRVHVVAETGSGQPIAPPSSEIQKTRWRQLHLPVESMSWKRPLPDTEKNGIPIHGSEVSDLNPLCGGTLSWPLTAAYMASARLSTTITRGKSKPADRCHDLPRIMF